MRLTKILTGWTNLGEVFTGVELSDPFFHRSQDVIINGGPSRVGRSEIIPHTKITHWRRAGIPSDVVHES